MAKLFFFQNKMSSCPHNFLYENQNILFDLNNKIVIPCKQGLYIKVLKYYSEFYDMMIKQNTIHFSDFNNVRKANSD